ncbi:MAG: tRNA 4-thiouridine(8) synthase ThiI, partial [Clostridia bacterium]|nr:tRNA 4-thiouridine(8) synthase ThiI [Clostridia bacterium]
MKNAIIIRYCEIHLKGKNRGYFERLLKENIERNLSGIEHRFYTLNARDIVEDFSDEDYPVI